MSTSAQNTYLIGGLRIACEIPLGLPKIECASNDVAIRIGQVELAGPLLHDESLAVCASASGIQLRYNGVGTFDIQDGRRVIFQPDDTINDDLMGYCVTSVVLAVLFQQRGRLVLHGSAIAIGEYCIAVVGARGSGKSTLATAMMRRNHTFVTDDLLAAEIVAGGRTRIWPTSPHLHLWHDSAALISLNRDNAAQETKERFEFSRFALKPCPLAHVYVLEPAAHLNLQTLPGGPAVIELTRHSYFVRLLTAMNSFASHLEQCSAIANSVPISRLHVPHDFAALDNVCDAIEGLAASSAAL